MLTVKSVEHLTPKMVRVLFAGNDLSGFVSLAPDDHVKLFFPPSGQQMPAMTDGIDPGTSGSEDRSLMRDFTPRRYDPNRNELTIDFALHEVGPATDWARRAAPGQILGAGGPRGSFVVSDDFDWYFLVGDETALPAIGRRLEELRERVPTIVVVAVTGPEENQHFVTKASVETIWVHRPSSEAHDPVWLMNAVARIACPPGDGFVWIAGESETVKRLRDYFIDQRRIPKTWVKAAGYWRPGKVSVHETYQE